MPTYEYACRDCGHRFDIRQGIRDEALTICPSCGGAIRRVMQPVGIVFKGSGFYKTDSRSNAEAAITAADRKDEKGADAAPAAEKPAGAADAPAATPPPASPSSGSDAAPAPAAPAPKPAAKPATEGSKA